MARKFNDASSEDLSTTTLPVSGLPFTIQAWFRTHDHAAGKTIVSIGDIDATNDYWTVFVLTNGKLRFRTRSNGSGGNADTANTITDNVWHHAHAHFYASGSTEVILDGDSANKGTNSSQAYPVAADELRIGSRVTSGSRYYMDGEIAELAIWDSFVGARLGSKIFNPLLHQGTAGIPKFYAPLIRDEDQDRIGGILLAANNTPSVAPHPRVIFPAPPLYPAQNIVAAGAPHPYYYLAGAAA